MQSVGSRSSSPTQTASSATSPYRSAQPTATPTASAPVHHISDMEPGALVLKGEQNREQAKTAKQREENRSHLGDARFGIANAKDSTSTAHTDAIEEGRPGTSKAGTNPSLMRAVEGLRINPDKDKGKAKATSGFSLGSGGAHFKAKKALTPEEQEAKKANRKELLEHKQMAAREARVNDRMSRRVPTLPTPEHLEIHHDKLDGYALNSAHKDGGPKSVTFASAGFKRINTWEQGKPDSYRVPAAADHEYQVGRNALVTQIKQEAQSIHATMTPHPTDEKYYTKHRIFSPEADASHKPAVARATWQYDRKPDSHDVGRLTSLVPSGYSTDEDAEKVANSKKK